MTRRQGLFCSLFLLSAWAIVLPNQLSMAAEPDFFVAVNGNDQWSGKLAAPTADGTDGPFLTVQRAQQAVRELKQAQPDRDHPVIVAIRGGTYWLDSPISFSPEDSGTEQSPIVYQAYGDERPIFSGGRPITGWTVDASGRWVVDLPEVKDGQWSFCQLFVGDQRRFRPQMPKKATTRSPKPAMRRPKQKARASIGLATPKGNSIPLGPT
jgi:hypothetical protein